MAKHDAPRILLYWHDLLLPHSRFILEAFDANKWNAAVLALAPERRGAAAPIFTVGGETETPLTRTTVKKVKTYGIRETWCRFSEWRRHVKEFQPDVLVVFDEALSINLLLAGLANRFYGRGVVLFYGFENIVQGTGWKEFHAHPNKRTLMALLRKSLRWLLLDKLMMPLRRRVIHGGLVSYRECADVVHAYTWNPPMPEQFWAINEKAFDEAGAKADIGLPTRYNVGYVGRFIPEKGIPDLISAMALLGSDYGLVLVGDGPQKSELEKQVQTLGLEDRINFLPPQNQTGLARVYRALNLLVLPSRTMATWKEQFGRVLMEARYCGTPAAGSDTGAIPFVISDASLIFREGDVPAIAETIRSADRRSAAASDKRSAGAGDFVHAWLTLAGTIIAARR